MTYPNQTHFEAITYDQKRKVQQEKWIDQSLENN